jgi:DNA-binding CsgD family transcriptional regulator
VKTYLRNTMRKLGARNRLETVHVARCAGLLG